MGKTLRSIATLGIAAGVALLPLGVCADTLDQPFLVTMTTQTANGTVAYRDVLVLRSDSSIAGAPDSLERDGSCLAIVQRVLAAGATRKPYAIGVALDDDHALEVPMTGNVTQPGSGARLVEAAGTAAGNLVSATASVTVGVHVDARVLAQDGHLEAATFQELTFLNNPAQPVEVSACSMQRIPQAPPAAAPAGPAATAPSPA
jgi:hypothetical protein